MLAGNALERCESGKNLKMTIEEKNMSYGKILRMTKESIAVELSLVEYFLCTNLPEHSLKVWKSMKTYFKRSPIPPFFVAQGPVVFCNRLST